MPTKMTLEIPRFIGASATLSTEILSISTKGQPTMNTKWKRITMTRYGDMHTTHFHELVVSGALLHEIFLYIRVEKQNKLTHLRVMRLENVMVTEFHIFGDYEEIEFDAGKVTSEDISMSSPAAWTGF